MLFNHVLFLFFSCFALLASFFVILTNNPVFSLLFLVLTYVNVACSLFLFNFEFLPISFLIIYVGAIAVLFLFVLMMLNIKITELQKQNASLLPVGILFGFIFTFELIFLLRSEFVNISILNESSFSLLLENTNTWLLKSDFLLSATFHNNLANLGITIFSDFLYQFLVSAYILLLAMIAAIVLTVQKSFVNKNQNVYVQLMADYDNSIANFL